ncbi:MAG TPA: site-2 protease family protein [Candidatus Limnocylindria bacterium]|nr:site-2 protease family protein [Candidatus Limnocylindria bacterium]
MYALVTYALARGLEMLPAGQAYLFGGVCALALFASVVAHEFAHALVARRFGVRTSAITLFLFGGVATLDEEPPTPRAEAWIALAGPALSALLAVAAFGLMALVERTVPGRSGIALGLLGAYLALANGVLAVFNLVPAYPMDGGRVLRALLWHLRRDRLSATAISARIAIGFALALVAAGVLCAMATRNAIYAWYVVLGVFLLRQGWTEERATHAPAPGGESGVPAAA